MKERPILMSGPMVRALLDGTKTQTRRVVKPQPFNDPHGHGIQWHGGSALVRAGYGAPYVHCSPGEHFERALLKCCPHGQPGDRLWVRETWCCVHGIPSSIGPHPDDFVRYRADDEPGDRVLTEKHCWKPSIYMPRVYSRIALEITGIRVERLHDISESDSRAEGIADGGCMNCGNPEPCACAQPSPDARDSYCRLWEQINGAGSWAVNPWVWVISFRKIIN